MSSSGSTTKVHSEAAALEAKDVRHEPSSESTSNVDLGSVDDLPTSTLDDAVLRAQGHEAAMPRMFSFWSSLGLGFSITNSWVGYLSNFGQNLVYGGPQSVVFGLLVAAVCQWTITLGLSEIASAFPSSGVRLSLLSCWTRSMVSYCVHADGMIYFRASIISSTFSLPQRPVDSLLSLWVG